MNNVCITLGILGSLWTVPTVAMTLLGVNPDPVRVNFCCPDGRMLKLRRVEDYLTGESYKKTECVRQKGVKNTLEGMEVAVLDLKSESNKYVQRKLNKLNYQKPVCGRGLQIREFSFNKTGKL